MTNWNSIEQKDKLQIKILDDKLKLSESNIESIQKNYEEIIKEKNEKIRELEIENEVLKKQLEFATAAKTVEKVQPKIETEISSPLTDMSRKSYRKRREKSDYIVSTLKLNHAYSHKKLMKDSSKNLIKVHIHG